MRRQEPTAEVVALMAVPIKKGCGKQEVRRDDKALRDTFAEEGSAIVEVSHDRPFTGTITNSTEIRHSRRAKVKACKQGPHDHNAPRASRLRRLSEVNACLCTNDSASASVLQPQPTVRREEGPREPAALHTSSRRKRNRSCSEANGALRKRKSSRAARGESDTEMGSSNLSTEACSQRLECGDGFSDDACVAPNDFGRTPLKSKCSDRDRTFDAGARKKASTR